MNLELPPELLSDDRLTPDQLAAMLDHQRALILGLPSPPAGMRKQRRLWVSVRTSVLKLLDAIRQAKYLQRAQARRALHRIAKMCKDIPGTPSEREQVAAVAERIHARLPAGEWIWRGRVPPQAK